MAAARLLAGLAGHPTDVPVCRGACRGERVGTLALGGWSFSTQALAPNFGLESHRGLPPHFRLERALELAKALAKFALVAVVTGVLRGGSRRLLELGALTLQAALARAAWLAGLEPRGARRQLCCSLPRSTCRQYWQHRRQLRMTKQEAKDEQKEREGTSGVARDSQLAARNRARRMMEAVQKADVVAMNPTHYAVALSYEAGKMQAPRVVAKGADYGAQYPPRRRSAKRADLRAPAIRARPVYTSEIGKEIPPRLYVAVAQVLTYVYQLTGRRRAEGSARRPGQRPAEDAGADIDADLRRARRGPVRGVEA